MQAQLELMKQNDQSLLATVHWALAATFGMWILITTVLTVINYRSYQRDKDTLLQEVRAKIAEESANLNAKIDTKLTGVMDKFTVEFSSKAVSLEGTVKSGAEILGKSLKAEFQSKIDAINRQLIEAEYKFNEVEVDRWTAQKIEVNVLLCLTYMLELSVKIDPSYKVSSDLEKIQNSLKRIAVANSTKPSPEVIRRLNAALGKVSDEHRTTVNAIRRLMDQLAA